jgi:hypothetical protein
LSVALTAAGRNRLVLALLCLPFLARRTVTPALRLTRAAWSQLAIKATVA